MISTSRRIIAVLSLLASAPFLSAVEIVAHRGASYDAPENTVAAFNEGWKQNADACELDIHQTSDGRIVVLHDPNTKRTAKKDLPVAKQPFDEVRQLDAGLWKGEKWKDEKIPTLLESLATIPAGKRLYIEIKCSSAVLPALEADLKASGRKAPQLVIIGFDFDTCALAKKRFPEIPVFWLVSYKADKATGALPKVEDLLVKSKGAGLDGLDLDYKFPIDAAFVEKCKAAGQKLLAWTVDDAEAAKSLVAAGVEGITTNRPAWLREQLTVKK